MLYGLIAALDKTSALNGATLNGFCLDNMCGRPPTRAPDIAPSRR